MTGEATLPNYPTSDIQFLAEYVRRLHAGDQIGAKDRHRIDVLAEKGHSSSADEVGEVDPVLTVAPEFPDATQVRR